MEGSVSTMPSIQTILGMNESKMKEIKEQISLLQDKLHIETLKQPANNPIEQRQIQKKINANEEQATLLIQQLHAFTAKMQQELTEKIDKRKEKKAANIEKLKEQLIKDTERLKAQLIKDIQKLEAQSIKDIEEEEQAFIAYKEKNEEQIEREIGRRQDSSVLAVQQYKARAEAYKASLSKVQSQKTPKQVEIEMKIENLKAELMDVEMTYELTKKQIQMAYGNKTPQQLDAEEEIRRLTRKKQEQYNYSESPFTHNEEQSEDSDAGLTSVELLRKNLARDEQRATHTQKPRMKPKQVQKRVPVESEDEYIERPSVPPPTQKKKFQKIIPKRATKCLGEKVNTYSTPLVFD